jgi:quinol monooxygenase YgiN
MKTALALFALLTAPAFAADEHPIVKDMRAKLKDPAKPFTMWVSFKVKPGREAAFEKAATACMTETVKEKGCVAYQLNHDADHADTYVLYERWKNLDALAAHLKEKHTEALLKTIPDLIDGGPQIKVYVAKE